jgi:hypothetical protein
LIDVLVFAIGFVIVVGTMVSAIRTVILPRAAQSWLTRIVFLAVRLPFMAISGPQRPYETRDRILALYGPVALVSLPLVWLAIAAIGFMFMFWSVQSGPWGDAFHLSVSSLTTLGFAPAGTFVQQVLAFVESGLGLTLVALMISFLPAIYTAFARREVQVGQLEVRAGSPPSAMTFLERHWLIGALDDADELDSTFQRWERWFAQIEESHLTYPALVFFRSPQSERSWVTAAGTMLDTASLVAACLPRRSIGSAGLCIRSGYLALRRIATFFGIEFDHDPSPDDPISIERSEFDQVWNRLAELGIELNPNQDQAWRDFAGWRVNYDTVLLALADVTVAAYAPWTSDRSPPSGDRPRVRRFGSSRTQPADPDSAPLDQS